MGFLMFFVWFELPMSEEMPIPLLVLKGTRHSAGIPQGQRLLKNLEMKLMTWDERSQKWDALRHQKPQYVNNMSNIVK